MKTSNVDSILMELKTARENDQKTVLVTGVFDVLHQEHLNFLQKAKGSGDYLVVGIETDQRVRQMKGEGRPKNSETGRLLSLKSLNIADSVFMLPEKFNQPKDHQKLISLIQPDILAISSHTSHQEEKRKIMETAGGKLLIVHPHNPKTSTTKMLNTKS